MFDVLSHTLPVDMEVLLVTFLEEFQPPISHLFQWIAASGYTLFLATTINIFHSCIKLMNIQIINSVICLVHTKN